MFTLINHLSNNIKTYKQTRLNKNSTIQNFIYDSLISVIHLKRLRSQRLHFLYVR